DLAHYHMARKQWDKARPYAEAAAESYAAFALLCVAECEEGAENYEAAEKWYRAAAERYPHMCFDWYLSCEMTGQMNPRAARRLTALYVASFGGRIPDAYALQAARFYALNDQFEKALPEFQRVLRSNPTPLHAYFVLLLADALGKEEVRERTLKDLE